jgi:hypothetical protein
VSIENQKHINTLIQRLEIASILMQLPESFELSEITTFESRELNSLVGYSSILSLSELAEEKSLSYEIITRLLEYTAGKSEQVISAAKIIFSRIGNFPGRTLLKQRHSEFNNFDVSPSLKLECVAREIENTHYTSGDNSVLLTDFQYKFLSSLKSEDSLSVSAPTSAGKSFVLNLDLIRQIKASSKQSIVYIVPTRALISEVSSRIRGTLKSEGLVDVLVRTAPFPVDIEKITSSVVYVLTQERMMSFLNSQDVKPFVTSLIVDEAHEIQNGKRGIVLQNAIDITLSRFLNTKILFASPLIRNPSYFLTLFGKNSNGKFFVETVSPVSQNVILVNPVNLKTCELDISLLTANSVVAVGNVKIPFKFRGAIYTQRANFAFAVSSMKDAVISFSNGPSDAEKVASNIATLVTDFQPDEDILSFVDFIKKEIHPEYPLIDCVLSGVAFHYGNMPSLVRSGIENLFKDGHIKIICCTSTLLQGVNLPAKHIIIENPMSGDNPMTRADFLNLSGRAGRLLKEFHGNIWCIRPETWNSSCYKGDKLQEISSAISSVMLDGGISVKELLVGSGDVSDDKAEAAFGKLYHDYLKDPELLFVEDYRNDGNSDALDETFEEIKKIQVTLPIEILENNKSLRPDHLQSLYVFLSTNVDINEAFPMHPYSEGAKYRMESIFNIIKKCFNWNITDTYSSWVSYLAYQWVWGEPIGKILGNRVSFVRGRNKNDSVSSVIRGCLRVLENDIRFKLVKYFSAYIEVLRYVAIEKKVIDEAGSIEPYHIYLEFGSCNRHTLNLMALGISRFTALHLKDKFDLPEGVEAEVYLDKMSKMNLDLIKMPSMCLKELKELIS